MKHDIEYAKEYLKHNPGALLVCVVLHQNRVVGVYTPEELMCATIPMPCEIEYHPIIGLHRNSE